MAKRYGGRWQIVDGPPLGQGGQSEVFRVTDVSRVLTDTFALKRVLNPNRHARFRAEIEAITRLQHPNIIKLVDHSAFTDDNQDTERQFLVMPIAEGRDLSNPGRLALYKDAIDAVIQIAKQIASALGAAHASGVFHRDIKPQNILFTGNGHELWVTDFGICLIHDRARATEASEVVGPRDFMAPELEDGGQLDVTPAVDVYSLGKVIYYALSGGVILPRERIHELRYSSIFAKGERYTSLELLLRQMICPVEQRLPSMRDVIERLENIEEWERQARRVPISQQGLAALDQLQRKVMEEQRIVAESKAASDRHAQLMSSVKEGFMAWLKAELEKAAAQVGAARVFKCAVQALTKEPRETWQATWGPGPGKTYMEIDGFELQLDREESPRLIRREILQVRLCGPLFVSGSVTVLGAAPPQPSPPDKRANELVMIPFYKRVNVQPYLPPQGISWGYITKPELIGQRRPTGRDPQRPTVHSEYIVAGATRSFHPDVNLLTKFEALDWPNVADRLRSDLSLTIDSFLNFLAVGGVASE